MTIILGYILAILFLLISAAFITHKMKAKSLHRMISKIHKPLGYVFIALILIHFIFSLQVFHTRPISIYILGGLMVILSLTALFTYLFRKKWKKAMSLHKLTALLLLICLAAHVYCCIDSLSSYQKQVSDISYSSVSIGDIPDGEYIGECDVTYIYARVKVFVKDGTISQIQLLEHRTERGKPGEKVIDNILSSQEIDVDTITSATNSSRVIKKAVDNALATAQG